MADGDVRRGREQGEEAKGLAVLGDVGDARGEGLARGAAGHELAVEADLAPGGQGARQGQAQGRAARAHQTGYAHDLALPDGERDVLEEAGRGEAAHLEQEGAGSDRAGRELLGEIPADHRADEGGAVEGRGLSLRHLASVAQHGHAVGEGEDLLEAVGDVEDGQALLAQAAQEGEEAKRTRHG